MTAPLNLPGFPSLLSWETPPAHFVLEEGGGIQMRAAPCTDFFLDPRGSVALTNSARLLFTPDPVFLLSAYAQAELVATYDAAVLMLYVDDRHWAKLCLERSPQGQPMIVSVVTNDTSDDCNSVVLEQPAAWLRVASFGQAFALHYSLDNTTWHFVRYFALRQTAGLRAGFSVQAPTGSGCQITFSQIRYTAAELADLRSGC